MSIPNSCRGQLSVLHRDIGPCISPTYSPQLQIGLQGPSTTDLLLMLTWRPSNMVAYPPQHSSVSVQHWILSAQLPIVDNYGHHVVPFGALSAP